MNIVNQLTVRQLLLNKRRTLVTIIGAIISVAMITAVATLGVSFLDMMQRQSIADEGEWHVLYPGVNQAQLDAIKADTQTKTVILSRDTGYAPLAGGMNKNKPYLFIKEYNKAGFENFPVQLKDGRFPEKADELVISEAILTNAKVDYKIGDSVTLDIGRRQPAGNPDTSLDQRSSLIRDEDGVNEILTKEMTKTYTIVGIIKRPDFEPTWSPGYTVLSYVDESITGPEGTVNASVILKKVDRTLFDHAKELAAGNKIGEPQFNSSLLRYYGVFKKDSLQGMLNTLTAIIMGIIVVGSVALIYNAFAISVSERSRYLGMLSSVGATKKQKRNSVLFEGFIIGSISIPLGILSGLLGIGITFLCINPIFKGSLSVTEDFRLVVMPSTILLAVLVSALTIMISTYIPARRASNISAIDAIRQSADLKIKGKAVKTSWLTRKLFGIEGELGLKNLKRNRGRYKATVVSLIISMVLFMVVSYFTSSMRKTLSMTQEGINFDIQVSLQSPEKEMQNDLMRRINSLEGIQVSTRVDSVELVLPLDEKSTADFVKNTPGAAVEDGKYIYYPTINALDDEALEAYAKNAGVDLKQLKDTAQPSAIVIDTTKYKDMVTDQYYETKAVNLSVGQKLEPSYFSSQDGRQVSLEPLQIAALTDQMPMGVMSKGNSASFNIIVSKDLFEKIVEDNEGLNHNTRRRLLLKTDNPMRMQEKLEDIESTVGEGSMFIFNVYMARQSDEQLTLLMSVFVYGFILLITAICIANILNTISTSIALRKREFAMLKSVGMTPQSFNRMINYESIFYGIKALLYGLPISFAAMYLIYRTLMTGFRFGFVIPWMSLIVTMAGVFVIVGVAMLYSSAKVKKENIIDVLKQEII